MSLTLSVELLTGRYGARSGTSDRVEWPPHPARLFFALVAAWAYEEPRSSHERAALEWLADQGAPEVACSEMAERRATTHFVPVNDTRAVAAYDRTYLALRDAERDRDAARSAPDARALARTEKTLQRALAKAASDSRRLRHAPRVTDAALGLMPERRLRQARTFPTAIPFEPRFAFRWPQAAPSVEQRREIDGIAARVSRLGHPSSLVSCRVSEEALQPRLVPDPDGSVMLRSAAPGILDLLDEAFARHQGHEPRVLPAEWAAYRHVGTPTPPSPSRGVFGQDWVVLAISAGPRPPIAGALSLTRRVREQLLRHAGDPAPEVLSGLAGTAPGRPGSPSTRPHVALVPLAFVGSPHASGTILGIAVVLPRGVGADERRIALRALAAWQREQREGLELRLGRSAVRLTVVDDLDQRRTLRPDTWCAPATRWASVTPVALDRLPHHLLRGTPALRAAAENEAEGIIRRSCLYVGLPEPARVSVRHDGPLAGVPPRRAFAPYTAGDGRVRRVSVHAVLEFAEPAAGPVLIGAGRYLGYGLFRPLDVASSP